MVPFIEYFQRFSLTILLCLFLVQCSNNSGPEHIRILDEIPQHIREVENLSVFPGDSEPSHSIELIPEQTFGKSGEPYLTHVQECVVGDKGRVIILDRNNSRSFPFPYRLYVYNADGTYHTQIGSLGRGPGEYGMIFGVQAKAGKVIVYDYTSQRLNVYTTNDYSFKRSTLIERWGIRDHEAARGRKFGGIESRNDGNHIVIFFEPNSDITTYLLMDTDGDALDFRPLLFPNSPSIKAPDKPMSPSLALPFMGSTITALSGEDGLYSVWTRDFLIKKYDANGVYQSAVYYPIQGAPFDLNEYAKTAPFSYNARDIEKAFENMEEELPETSPVIADMIVDDENRIWVAVPAGVQGETYEWWILKESGELLAKLLLPRDQPIYDIRNGYLFSKKTNEKTDTEYAVKYRIELTKKW